MGFQKYLSQSKQIKDFLTLLPKQQNVNYFTESNVFIVANYTTYIQIDEMRYKKIHELISFHAVNRKQAINIIENV